MPWTVLADPEGDVFCVLQPRAVCEDTGPVAAVAVHAEDPRTLARFWDGALDWTRHEVTDDLVRFRSATGVGPYLELVRSPDPGGVPTRFHLDVLPSPGDDQAAEVTRLRALGASPLDVGQGDVPWVCPVDPEGDPFCVLAPR